MVKCRNCANSHLTKILNLGTAPPSNAYLSEADLSRPEIWYPLRLNLCERCWLVQTEDFHGGEDLFTASYAYFSSTSQSWLSHSESFAVSMTKELALGKQSLVIEAASNDGYLLQYFDALGVPTLGIEPTLSTADAARDKGLRILQEFLTRETADLVVGQFGQADLVVANNVIAHVPDLPDFISALGRLVKPEGLVSVEFPRVDRLVRLGQFDTVYHEHFSYFSLTSLSNALEPHGLRIIDVVSLETHGGSYRALIRRDASKHSNESDRLKLALGVEDSLGVASVSFYDGLESIARSCKLDLLEFLTAHRRKGAPVVGYGAAAKGNTLFNYCGVKEDLVQAVVDRSPGKIGQFLPGSRIPIRAEESLVDLRPAVVLVLPWNLRDEIARQLVYLQEWGTELVTAVPRMRRISFP